MPAYSDTGYNDTEKNLLAFKCHFLGMMSHLDILLMNTFVYNDTIRSPTLANCRREGQLSAHNFELDRVYSFKNFFLK